MHTVSSQNKSPKQIDPERKKERKKEKKTIELYVRVEITHFW